MVGAAHLTSRPPEGWRSNHAIRCTRGMKSVPSCETKPICRGSMMTANQEIGGPGGLLYEQTQFCDTDCGGRNRASDGAARVNCAKRTQFREGRTTHKCFIGQVLREIRRRNGPPKQSQFPPPRWQGGGVGRARRRRRPVNESRGTKPISTHGWQPAGMGLPTRSLGSIVWNEPNSGKAGRCISASWRSGYDEFIAEAGAAKQSQLLRVDGWLHEQSQFPPRWSGEEPLFALFAPGMGLHWEGPSGGCSYVARASRPCSPFRWQDTSGTQGQDALATEARNRNRIPFFHGLELIDYEK